jgi:hypothetical protein
MSSIMIKITPILLLVVLWMNLVESEASDATVVTESEVLILLRGYEWELDVEALKALPADTGKVLLDIAGNETYPVYIKSRAITALGQFPSDAVWTFLHAELATADSIERRRIVDAICRTFSADRPGQVEAAISVYLNQQDAHLRVTVARCLQAIGSDTAMEKIRRYQKATVETAAPWERKALNR